MDTDIIKIREDALKVKQENLQDHLECIDKQSKISFGYITIIGILLAAIYSSKGLPFNQESLFLGGFIILVASYNILGKQITLHTDMSKVFVENYGKSYFEYLGYRYKDIAKKYTNASKLLTEKHTINRVLFFMLLGYVFYILLFIF